MKFVFKTFLFLVCLNSSAWGVFYPRDTMRAGSSGSAGATGQSPVYDAGVRGPNAAMGEPDVTAVNPEGRPPGTKKKPVGTIRLEASPSAGALPPPTPETESR